MNNPHKNARTTYHNRVLIIDRVLNEGRSVHSVAADFGISARTVYKWLARFEEHGYAGLHSASSRPHSSPYQLPDSWIECIRLYRQTFKWCARKIAETLSVAYSTVTAVLRRLKLNKARHIEPQVPVQRYEHAAPGDMLHMDIKKLPKFDRPGHRVTGNRKIHSKGARYECVHICIDDHSRWAYAEVLPDEKKETTSNFLQRALAAYAVIGVSVRRLMTDNGPALPLWAV